MLFTCLVCQLPTYPRTLKKAWGAASPLRSWFLGLGLKRSHLLFSNEFSETPQAPSWKFLFDAIPSEKETDYNFAHQPLVDQPPRPLLQRLWQRCHHPKSLPKTVNLGPSLSAPPGEIWGVRVLLSWWFFCFGGGGAGWGWEDWLVIGFSNFSP